MAMEKSLHRFAFLVAMMVFLGTTSAAVAQEAAAEKTFTEKAKEYWDRMVAGLESGAKAAGEEYSKLKADAAKATGPARAKMAAQMEVLSQKWAAAREKLGASLDSRMKAASEEFTILKEKAATATGPAREKLSQQMTKLGEEMSLAKEKLATSFSANMKATSEEFQHLKEQAASASADAKVKMQPKLDKLKAEWAKNREKLGAYLEADLKQTKEDMAKLGAATSAAATSAKEKLAKKYQELTAKKEALEKDKEIEDEK